MVRFYIICGGDDKSVWRLQEELVDTGHECDIVPACRPEEAADMMRSEGLYSDRESNLQPEQLGKFLSHRRVWERIVEDGGGEHVVLDGVSSLASGFRGKMDELMKELDGQADAVVLWRHPHNDDIPQDHHEWKTLTSFSSIWGLTAYLIRPHFAAHLLRSVRYIRSSIDIELALGVFPRHDVLVAVPELFVC